MNGNLVISRRAGQCFTISLRDLDEAKASAVLQSLMEGGISIEVTEVNSNAARIKVSAHKGLTILRDELIDVGRQHPGA